jgi:phage anti-repressor protein
MRSKFNLKIILLIILNIIIKMDLTTNKCINKDTFNFTELVKVDNPITIESKMITIINQEFTEDEQRWYVANLYMYMNYHPTKDFPINLEHVYKMIGFANKGNAMKTIKSNFVVDEDYKSLLFRTEKQNENAENRGGHNKEDIMLNVDTFKNLCMIVKTDKGKAIRKYYVKLENIYNRLIKEEMKEREELLIQQRENAIKLLEQKDQLLEHKDQLLEQKDFLLEQKDLVSELEKEQLLETTLLKQFPPNTQCIYYGKIDNKDSEGGNLIKFGNSNNLQERVKAHKKTYKNFRLTNVFKVSNKIEIENCIKQHPILKLRIRYIIIDDINYRELMNIDPRSYDMDFTLTLLDSRIKEIIEENQYNIENYNKLLDKNQKIQEELYRANDKIALLTKENEKLQQKVDKFSPKTNSDEEKFKHHNRTETSGGYSLYAYTFGNLRYKVGLCKTATIDSKTKVYSGLREDSKMVLETKLKHPFVEKLLLYLLKRHLVFLNNDTFDGSLEDIKVIFDIVSKIEELFIKNDIFTIKNKMDGQVQPANEEQYTDPEVPVVRKSQRPIDQIDKDTGKILNTYKNLTDAGKSIGLTTGTAVGIALRNKSLCQGFLWRYSGVSLENQMREQQVIKINCKTGERTHFANIGSAARDSNISPPGLRNRILTQLHVNNCHWEFDESATHVNL